jgi:hypothetical protein
MAKKSTPRDGCGHRKGVRGGGGYNAVFDTPTTKSAKTSLFGRLRVLVNSLGR